MRAAWFVRARQMETRFKFYLAILGYDRRDRSLTHKIYLVYAVVFFAIWGFAVMSLLASSGAVLLSNLSKVDPSLAAVRLGWLALVGWGIYTLFQATRRSPLVFSEEDAYLICQTPVDRRAVALAWFPADWLETALAFWAIAVVLGFSLAELHIGPKIGLVDLPEYVTTGLRALGALLPVQLGLHALLWAVGCIRLWRERGPVWLKPAALAVVGLAVISLLWVLSQGGITAALPAALTIIYAPILYPLQAGFGQVRILAGLGAGWLLSGVGLLALWLASEPINLSRAAQETHDLEAVQAAAKVGQTDLAQELTDRRQLGIGHAPSRLPGASGLGSLPWKDMVQSLRLIRLSDIFAWLSLAGCALGVALLPSWEGRILALAFWVIAAAQRGASRFRRDLAQWSILRQLPFPADGLMIADLAPAWLMVVLLSGLCLLPWLRQAGDYGAAALILLPSVAAGVIFLGAHDILRQANVATLLVGRAPEVSARGAGLGLLLTAAPLMLIYWMGKNGLLLDTSLTLAVGISLGLAYFAWRLAANALQGIE